MREAKAASYRQGLEAYREAVGPFADTVPEIRVETHFESLKDWSLFETQEGLEAWFQQQRDDCPMAVSEIGLAECSGWSRDDETGDYAHASGEFFRVHGVRVRASASREVGGQGWDQPFLTQVGYDGGILGLLRQRHLGVPHYLVEAKAEPGNYEIIQMSPTLQATFSNLKRAHAGRRPRFAELFENPQAHDAIVHYKQWMSEDGGRLFNKRNLGMLVELPEGAEVEVPPGFQWVSLYQLKTCLLLNAWVNPHIRGIISHL